MGVIKNLKNKPGKLENNEPNIIKEVGYVGGDYCNQNFGKDWVTIAPTHISPTIKNCRRAARFPTVVGIVSNLIVKILSSFTINGDPENEDAVKHIRECDKIWDLNNLCFEGLWNNIVDGTCFYEVITKDNHIKLRILAFDGKDHLIKEVTDEFGDVIGYVQKTKAYKPVANWKDLDYDMINNELVDKTVAFDVDEISNPVLININGEGFSLVKNIIDLAFYANNLY